MQKKIGCKVQVKKHNTQYRERYRMEDSRVRGNDIRRGGNEREENTEKFALGSIEYNIEEIFAPGVVQI